MTRRISLDMLVSLIEGDRDFIQRLIEEGIVYPADEGFSAEQVDMILASRTLFHDMHVNLPGIDIILRMRRELAMARRRIAELEARLRNL